MIKYKSSHYKFYTLSFIKDLIYNPESINTDEKRKDNSIVINELNDFLCKDFDKICELFSKKNYLETKRKLTEGLNKTFFLKFPFAKKHIQ